MKLDIIKIMYFSASENGTFLLIKRVLVFSLIWATIFYGITLNRWYLGGFLILVPAITQLCTIIYCYFSSPRRSLRSNVLFSVVFFAYVTIRHIISRDLLTQGVSDLFLFAFTAFCLISFSKDEYIDFFKNSSDDGVMAVTDYIDDEKPLYVATDERNMQITGFFDSIADFESKSQGNEHSVCNFISGGIYCLGPSAIETLELCMSDGLARMRNFQRRLVSDGRKLSAYKFSKILDIDHADDIVKAENFLAGK